MFVSLSVSDRKRLVLFLQIYMWQRSCHYSIMRRRTYREYTVVRSRRNVHLIFNCCFNDKTVSIDLHENCNRPGRCLINKVVKKNCLRYGALFFYTLSPSSFRLCCPSLVHNDVISALPLFRRMLYRETFGAPRHTHTHTNTHSRFPGGFLICSP